MMIRVEISTNTRRDIDGAAFAQTFRPDGRPGPHITGDRDRVAPWIERLRAQAGQHGHTVEVHDQRVNPETW